VLWFSQLYASKNVVIAIVQPKPRIKIRGIRGVLLVQPNIKIAMQKGSKGMSYNCS